MKATLFSYIFLKTPTLTYKDSPLIDELICIFSWIYLSLKIIKTDLIGASESLGLHPEGSHEKAAQDCLDYEQYLIERWGEKD